MNILDSVTKQSEIRSMSIECSRRHGINLAQGVCDVSLPPAVADGAKQAIDKGFNSYTQTEGVEELRQALLQKIETFNGIKNRSTKNILISSGATGALFCALFSLFKRGDEILLFEPYYGYHKNSLEFAGLTPVVVPTTAPHWDIDFTNLERYVSPKTRALILCTPSNPSGKVLSKEELSRLANFCNHHGLKVITDEIYEYFVFNGAHLSPGSMSEFKSGVITISGFSKIFSVTGWRIGYAVAEEHEIEAMAQINDLLYVCSPSALQLGAAKGLKNLNSSFYQKICASYFNKGMLLAKTLNDIGLETIAPQGAYYLLSNVDRLSGGSAKEKAMTILEKTGVACVPGTAFFQSSLGERFVRFCFAKELSVIQDACERLKRL